MTTPGQHDGSTAAALLPSREPIPRHRQLPPEQKNPRFLSAQILAYPKGPMSSSSDKKKFKMKPNLKCFTKQSTLSQLRGWENNPSATGGAALPAVPSSSPQPLWVRGVLGPTGQRGKHNAAPSLSVRQLITLAGKSPCHPGPQGQDTAGTQRKVAWGGRNSCTHMHPPPGSRLPPPLASRSPTLPRTEPCSPPAPART